MTLKSIWTLALAAVLLAACDDNTGSLGMDMLPDEDRIDLSAPAYPVELESVVAGPVAAKTSACYLGSFTDPETGLNTTIDFLAQLRCLDNFEFPKTLKEENITSAEVRMFYSSFKGDSLNPSKVKVYPLTKVLDNNGAYTSDINPADYYDTTAQPYVTKTYTARDGTVDEDYRNNTDSFSPHIKVVLPERAYGADGVTGNYGKYIFKLYKSHPEYFKDSYSFINNVCKGFYFQFVSGQGTMLNIDHVRLTVNFKYAPDETKPDSLVTGAATFAGTDEVIQTSHITHDAAAVKSFVDNANAQGNATYLSSPAGIFTAVTLPVDSLSETDSLNTARLSLTYYRNTSGSRDALGPSQYVLLVRKGKETDFFKNNQVNDNVTSYLASTSSSENTYSNAYVFPNIRSLMLTLRDEARPEVEKMMKEENLDRKAAYARYKAAHPDWDKVLIIPVTAVTTTSSSSTGSSSSSVVALYHNFSLSTAKLVKNGVKMQIIYSKIHN